jgi:endonuclease G
MSKELLILLLAFQSHTYTDFLPQFTSNPVVHHHYYSLSFNPSYLQADWVAYSITDSTAFGGVQRSSNFRNDDSLPQFHLLDDYENSGYDRGHLCPAGSMAFNALAMEESFFMTNMSPQKPGFNRGIWKKLEAQVRTWGYENQAIYVVTGPVLTEFIDTIGEIPVPKYYYKVILDIDTPEVKSIGFVLENASSSLPLTHFAVSIDSVETLTGIDFYETLPDSLEEFLESQMDVSLWSWTTIKVHKESVTTKKHTCPATTQTGQKCTRTVSTDGQFCWQHQNSSIPKVYVCGTSKVYHSAASHPGLKRCKSEIRELTLTEAQRLGLRQCKD